MNREVAAADKSTTLHTLLPNFWSDGLIWTPAGEPNAGDNVTIGTGIDNPLVNGNFPVLYNSTQSSETLLGSLRINAPTLGSGILDSLPGPADLLPVSPFIARGIHQGGFTLRTTSEIIGDNEAGYFLQTGGLHTVENDVTLGWKSTGLGVYQINATVDGIFRVRRDLFVGDAGTGILQQIGGELIVQRDLWFGRSTGSDGVGLLAGPVDVWGNVVVGDSGTAQLFSDASTFSIGGNLIFAQSAGSVGGLAMGANAATLVAGDIVVGGLGRGDLVHTGVPSHVHAQGSIIVGQGPGGIGKLDSLFGAGLIADQDLIIGDQGSGVGVNSAIPHVGRDLIVARAAGSDGGYSLAGDLLVGRDMIVGGGGQGRLTVNGGMPEIVGNVLVGVEATADGELKGLFTDWDIGGTMRVGIAGKGLAIVGGRLLVDGGVSVGEQAGSDGEIALDGLLFPVGTAETGILSSFVFVGGSGTGKIILSGAGLHAANEVLLGLESGGVGTLQLIGNNSTLFGLETPTITVGRRGTGTFTMDDSFARIQNDMFLGREAGSQGTFESDNGLLEIGGNLHLAEAGTAEVILWTNSSPLAEGSEIQVAGNLAVAANAASGSGSISMQPGSLLLVSGDTILGGAGLASFAYEGRTFETQSLTVGSGASVSFTGDNHTPYYPGVFGYVSLGTVTQTAGTVSFFSDNELRLVPAGTGSSGFHASSYSLAGGILTVPTLRIAGGSLVQTGGHLSTGSLIFEGGTVTGTIESTGSFHLGPTATGFDGGLITSGSFTLSQPFAPSGGFESTGTTTIGSGGALTDGTVTISGGTTTVQGGGRIESPDPMMVSGGTLVLESGSLYRGPQFTQTAGATDVQGGATFDVQGPMTVSGGTLTFGSGSNTTILGPLTLDSLLSTGSAWILNRAFGLGAGQSMVWQTELAGDGASRLGGTMPLTVNSGAALTIAGTGEKRLETALINHGAVSWARGKVTGPGTLENHGTFTITAGQGYDTGFAYLYTDAWAPAITNHPGATLALDRAAVAPHEHRLGALVNQGTVDTGAFGNLTVTGAYTGAGTFTGSGLVTFEGGGTASGPLDVPGISVRGSGTTFVIQDTLANLPMRDDGLGYAIPNGSIGVSGGATLRLEILDAKPYTFLRFAALGNGTLEVPGATAIQFAGGVAFGSGTPGGGAPLLPSVQLTVTTGSHAVINGLNHDVTLAPGSTAQMGGLAGLGATSHTATLTNHGDLALTAAGVIGEQLVDGELQPIVRSKHIEGGGTIVNAAGGSTEVEFALASLGDLHAAGRITQTLENQGTAVVRGVSQPEIRLGWWDGLIENFADLLFERGWMEVNELRQYEGTTTIGPVGLRSTTGAAIEGGTVNANGTFLQGNLALSGDAHLLVGGNGLLVQGAFSDGPATTVHLQGRLGSGSNYATGFQGTLILDGPGSGAFAPNATPPANVAGAPNISASFGTNLTATMNTVPAGATLNIRNGFNISGGDNWTTHGTLLVGSGSTFARGGGNLGGNGEIRVLSGGTMTLGGNGNWSGPAGAIIIESGGTLSLGSHVNGINRFNNREITNYGIVQHNASSVGLNVNSVITNNGTWTVAFPGSGDVGGYITEGGQTQGGLFVNNGTFNQNGTNHLNFNNGPAFVNNGTVNVNSGLLRFQRQSTFSDTSVVNIAAGATFELRDGTANIQSGARFQGAGTFGLGDAGNHTLTGAIHADNASFWGGTLHGTHTLTGTWNKSGSGGNMGTAGTTTIAGGATWNFQASTNLRGRTFVNQGTVNRSDGQLEFSPETLIQNHGTWNDANQGNSYASQNSPQGGLLENFGTFNKTAAGTLSFASGSGGPGFTNHGIVNISQGIFSIRRTSTFTGSSVANLAAGATLELRDGTNHLQDGARFLGAGTLSLGDAGSHTLTGAIHADNASFWGGTWHGTHTLTGTWNKSGSGGNMGTAGTTTIASGATWNFQASTNLRGRTFVNQGTVNRSDGQLEFSPETLIQNHGTWNDANQGNSYASQNSPQGGLLENFGTFNKTAAGTLSFASGSGGPGFTSHGIVNVNQGIFSIHRTSTFTGASVANIAAGATLLLRDGTNHLQDGARFEGAGTLAFGDAGQHHINGTVHADNGWHWGGTLQGTHTLQGNWAVGYGASMATAGTTTIAAGATFTFREGGEHRLQNRSFVNHGTVSHTDNLIRINATSTITNHGTWTDSSGASFVSSSDRVGLFENHGTFIKTGANTLTMDFYNGPMFSNLGTVDVQQGTLQLHRNLAQHSGSTLTGGTWIVRNGATLWDQYTTSYTINQGDVTLHGTGDFAGFSTLTQNEGTLRLLDGKTFSTTAAFTNSGTLVIGTGSSFGTTSTFASSGTLNLLGSASATGGLTNTGTLVGSGTLTGNVVSSGTIIPGTSPGLLTITGDLTLLGTSQLLMELGGVVQGISYDHLSVGGTLTLGGELIVSLLDGFSPVSGASFDLFDAAAFSGIFADLTLPALTAGLSWDTSALYSDGLLAVGGTAIPEPSTYAIVAGLAALAAAAWRRHGRVR